MVSLRPNEDTTAAIAVALLREAMADIDIQREPTLEPEDDYTYGEIIYWVIGILCIPAVPILMAWLFSPWSGM